MIRRTILLLALPLLTSLNVDAASPASSPGDTAPASSWCLAPVVGAFDDVDAKTSAKPNSCGVLDLVCGQNFIPGCSITCKEGEIPFCVMRGCSGISTCECK